MHVVLVHHQFPPVIGHGVGGIVRYLEPLAHGLAKLGNQVSVVCIAQADPIVERVGQITVHRVQDASSRVPGRVGAVLHPLGRSHVLARRVRRIHCATPIDVVEWVNQGAEGLMHALFPITAHVTRAVTMGPQTTDIKRAAGGRRSNPAALAALTWMETTAVRRSTSVVAPSMQHAAAAKRAYRLAATPRVVPLGLGGGRDLDPSCRSSGKDKRLHMLFVGRLEPRKGVDVLLAAFDRLHARMPHQVRLTIAGSDVAIDPDGKVGFGSQALTRMDPAARDAVSVLGWVADDALSSLYCSADVVVAPSRWESFGLVYLEAMQRGVALVAGAAGGGADIVVDGETGFLVDPGDVAGLSRALERLVVDRKLCAAMGKAGLLRWRDRYTADRMCQGTLSAYSEILHSSAPG